MTEHFRHRFLQALLAAKLISQRKATDLLSWKHSGFHIDNGGEAPVDPHDTAGRRRLAEYLLRAPFSLQKITWNPDTKTVIYRSRSSWHTKRNFEVFKATDFLAAAIEHIPPKGQQVIRYYGLYSNKTRGLTKPTAEIIPPPPENLEPAKAAPEILPAPPKATARAMRPLWRDLILRVWGTDPLKCPCCPGTMRRVETIFRPEEIEFFLRLHGLWEALISLPPPPEPPFDVEKRRGIGGVLDAGEAGARRVSPPCGAGESNLRTHPSALASHPRLDPRRRRRSPRLRHPRTLGPKRRPRPRPSLEGPRNRPRRRPHARPRIRLRQEVVEGKPKKSAAKNNLGNAEQESYAHISTKSTMNRPVSPCRTPLLTHKGQAHL